ncbi:hypothetical protein CEXT_63661 [Caerostris extrusa]|uniref:Uncharacterized protein n=1 Tax=Caerostris extrusa TaxID=172846 RepID=A0AAV4MFC7_CAEEX|nr:hypothetical protein CEXT_63661 [Caerostris extrusa]
MLQHAVEISEQDRKLVCSKHAVEIRTKESEQDREARLQQVSQHAAEIETQNQNQQMLQHAEIRTKESEQDREARL